MMTVSETAAAKILEIVAGSGEPDRQLLRISFSGHG
jgi:hypothetical protein